MFEWIRNLFRNLFHRDATDTATDGENELQVARLKKKAREACDEVKALEDAYKSALKAAGNAKSTGESDTEMDRLYAELESREQELENAREKLETLRAQAELAGYEQDIRQIALAAGVSGAEVSERDIAIERKRQEEQRRQIDVDRQVRRRQTERSRAKRRKKHESRLNDVLEDGEGPDTAGPADDTGRKETE